MDIDHTGPAACTDCGEDAYIRLAGDAGAEDYVCAHCFADRGRAAAVAADVVRASPSRPTRSVEGVAR